MPDEVVVHFTVRLRDNFTTNWNRNNYAHGIQYHEIIDQNSLRDCGFSKIFYLRVCLCSCPALGGLYLGYYGSGFDETWWKYWNLGLCSSRSR